MISGPTGLARTSDDVLALAMIKVVARPGTFTVQDERPAWCLEEELARMEVLGAVDGEGEAVRGAVGILSGA
jgi:hypothetical protein